MNLLDEIQKLYRQLRSEKRNQFKRFVSFGDLFTDRKEIAQFNGFGEGSTCYDNVLILGDVKVGKHTWIGPNVVLDGTAGLEIGDYCSISAGVQIYTHDTVQWSVSMGKEKHALTPTKIGHGVYLGPQTVVSRGVVIGDRAIVGANSFVNSDIPADSKAWGTPAQVRS